MERRDTMRDFWRSTTVSSHYPSIGLTEPSMRDELIDMMDGRYPEIPKAQPALLRHMRLSDGVRIPCPCVSSFGEQDKDRICPICLQEGFLWDETDVKIYRVLLGTKDGNALKSVLIAPGLINIPIVVFYIRYSELIEQHDKIVLTKLDEEGDAIIPITRKAIYRIETLWDYRSDNGRIEFWKAFGHLEQTKQL